MSTNPEHKEKRHYNKCYKAFKVKVKCHDTKSKASHLGSYILLYVIISVLCLSSSTITPSLFHIGLRPIKHN